MWQDTIANREEVTLVTASKTGEPNAAVVLSMGLVDGKLLLCDCQMETTIKNITENPRVVIVAKKEGEYYRIKGEVKLYDNGPYFEAAKNGEHTYPVRHAIVIEIKEIFDLDKLKPVEL